MKITLAPTERSSVELLFKTLDSNIQKADRYNAILDKKTPVNAQKGTLPIQAIDPTPYLKDSYGLVVKPEAYKEKGWSLFYDAYEPHEGFVYDELDINPKTFEETTRFGYFTSRFPFLALAQDGKTWMSVTPHEINTMESQIAEAKGKVITFGLGLGYYAYRVLEKKDVSSITVIERDPTLIAFFKNRLLPFFPRKNDFRIIEEDAFHYASGMAKENYDYAFVDLWHLPEDGLPMYIRMRGLEKKSPKTHYAYWVEPSLLSLLRRAVLILLQEEMAGSTDEDYDYAANGSDALINSLHKLLKKTELHNAQDVSMLISDESLKKIALRLA